MDEKYRLLRNVRYIDADAGRTDAYDFFYKIGKNKSEILKIGKNLRVGDHDGLNVVNMHGMHACAPFVDLRCTIPDPGYAYRENLQSGLLAAAGGGYGTLLLSPATRPSYDSAALLRAMKQNAGAVDLCRVKFAVPLTKSGKGTQKQDLKALKDAGAAAVACDFEEKESSAQNLLDGLLQARENDLLFISPCRKQSVKRRNRPSGARFSERAGAGEPDRLSEILALSEALALARYTGCPLHFPLVTQKESVDLLRRAKSEGVKITCATAPPYFAFSESEVFFSGSRAKFDPPLRREDDRAAVIEGLRDGTIDCICTDHTPLSASEKGPDYDRALPGGSGFDTAFAAGITDLVLPGHLSLSELIVLMATSPARILKTGKPLCVGGPLDLVFFDADEEMLYVESTMRSRGTNTPFFGRALRGRVKALYLDGDKKL